MKVPGKARRERSFNHTDFGYLSMGASIAQPATSVMVALGEPGARAKGRDQTPDIVGKVSMREFV